MKGNMYVSLTLLLIVQLAFCNLFTNSEQKYPTWFQKQFQKLSHVSGLAFDSDNQLAIFHRGDNVWNVKSFDENENYQFPEAIILEFTVLILDMNTGTVLNEWGNGSFILPHGITIDANKFYWLTDVALHQVFKYDRNGNKLLSLGEKLKPGNSKGKFCKPTNVAVAANGMVYISDGYCNSRIVVYDSRGEFQQEFPISINRATAQKLQISDRLRSSSILHSLAFVDNENILCVAMREVFMISCHFVNRQFKRSHLISKKPNAIYSIVSSQNDVLHAVGAYRRSSQINIFGYNFTSGQVIYDVSNEIIGVPHAMALSNIDNKLYMVLLDAEQQILNFDLMKKSLCLN